MSFHELAPTIDLARYVDGIWTLSQSQDGCHESLVLPDGCVEIVFAVEGSFGLAGQLGPRDARWPMVTVLGLATKPHGILYRGRAHMIGVRLTPAGAMRIVGTELSQLVNGAADGADILPALASRFTGAIEDLLESRGPDRLHCELRAAVECSKPIDPRIENAASTLHARVRGDSIGAVAEDVGLSTRQLDRCFDRWFGVPPKFIDRVARFRRAFSLGMTQPRTEWAAVAAHCGYADQSHLCREFLEFTHQTPERMRLAMASPSHYV